MRLSTFIPLQNKSISRFLFETCENLLQHSYNTDRVKSYAATYLCAATKQDVLKGVHFRFVKAAGGNWVTLTYNKNHVVFDMPVFNEYEKKLYGYLFSEFIEDEYLLRVPSYEPFVGKIKLASKYAEYPISFHSLRIARIKMLKDEGEVGEGDIAKCFGLKRTDYWFPAGTVPQEILTGKHRGIRLSD